MGTGKKDGTPLPRSEKNGTPPHFFVENQKIVDIVRVLGGGVVFFRGML